MPKRTSILLYCLAMALYAAGLLLLYGWPDNSGLFGDSFGAFTAFFTGLGFLAIAYTVRLQSQQVEMQAKELQLQREELALTRKELARSASAQETTGTTMAAQLETMRASALLAAIPILLTHEYEHVRKAHALELHLDVEALPTSVLRERLVELERADIKDLEMKCFEGNLNSIVRYREDAARLYSFLTNQSAPRSSTS